MKSIPEEFEQEFNNELIKLGLKRLQLACYIGIVCLLTFIILDYLLFPEQQVLFLKLRLYGVTILIVVEILIKVNERLVQQYLFQFSLLATLFGIALPLTIMIIFSGGHESPYYAGLLIIVIVLGLVFPWNLKQGGIAFGAIYGGYLGSILLFDKISNWPIFISNNFFLLPSIACGFISIKINNNYNKKVFISRINLIQANNTIQDAFSKLKKADEMKTNFLSSVSHEIRTPLTSVIGFAANTSKVFVKDVMPLLPEDNNKLNMKSKLINDNLAIIFSEGQRLTRLLNDVLDISKMEAGKLEWDIQELDLIYICKRSLSVLAGYPKSDQVEVTFGSLGICRTVKGDADRTIQVITNLMSNALKFTAQGRIELKVEFLERHALVSVLDSGLGISKKDLPEVFSKFKQVGDELTNKPKGTGLGLPICKEIVEHLGGKIWAESTIGKGSCFYFTMNYFLQQNSQDVL